MTDQSAYYHGTAADLSAGALIEPGRAHNFAHLAGTDSVYFTPRLESARWYAMLAADLAQGRVYQVEPTGSHAPDPESAGSFVPPSLSGARASEYPLRVIREVQPDEREAGS
jgi:Rifampin ADP-ribosyl transferase